MKIYARNFRGFESILIDLEKTYFLVGDNSSGKSSFLYLIDAVCTSDLNYCPKIDEDFGASRYDYFSPFFDYADVEFAIFEDSSAGDEYAKVITVRKRSGDQPQIVRCTHWFAGYYVTMKLDGGDVFHKHGQFDGKFELERVLKVHRSSLRGWKKSEVRASLIAEGPSIIKACDIKSKEQQRLVMRSLGLVMNTCRFVSPLRALPERFYSSVRKIDALGGHFAKVWLDLAAMDDGVLSDIDKFGQEAKLFDHLHVQEVETTVDDPPLLVTVEKYGKHFTLDQVGIGVSQVVPLLIDTVYSIAIDRKAILSQQPELHLHPIAQAALGSYLYRSTKSGLRAVYETHSSFLLDRYRSELRDDPEKPLKDGFFDGVSILFFSNESDGNKINEIKIRADGSLHGDPDEYHEFFLSEIVRTIF